MGLPYVVEYLLAQRDPTGKSPITFAGAVQTIVESFPPYFSLTLTQAPLGRDFAFIPYYYVFSPSMMPSAFAASGTHYGNYLYSGTVSSWFTRTPIPIEDLIFSTAAEPAQAVITNLTGLYQYYEGSVFFLRIPTEDNYNAVLAALKRLSTSQQASDLLNEANNYLAQIAGQPRPPASGEVG